MATWNDYADDLAEIRRIRDDRRRTRPSVAVADVDADDDDDLLGSPRKLSEDYTAGEWLGTAARNIPYSVAERFRETGEFISDPGAALSAMGSIASGAWDVATGDESEEAELARNVWEEIKAQTTDPRRIAEDPTAAIANIATLVAPFAGGTAAAARAAGVGGKAASTLGKIGKAADIVSDVPMALGAKGAGVVGRRLKEPVKKVARGGKTGVLEMLGISAGKGGQRTKAAYDIGRTGTPEEQAKFTEMRKGGAGVSVRSIGDPLVERIAGEHAARQARALEDYYGGQFTPEELQDLYDQGLSPENVLEEALVKKEIEKLGPEPELELEPEQGGYRRYLAEQKAKAASEGISLPEDIARSEGIDSTLQFLYDRGVAPEDILAGHPGTTPQKVPRTKADIPEIELQERELGRTGFEDEPLLGPQPRKTIETDASTPSGYADLKLSDVEEGVYRDVLKEVEVPEAGVQAYWDWYNTASPQERTKYLDFTLLPKALQDKGIRVFVDPESSRLAPAQAREKVHLEAEAQAGRPERRASKKRRAAYRKTVLETERQVKAAHKAAAAEIANTAAAKFRADLKQIEQDLDIKLFGKDVNASKVGERLVQAFNPEKDAARFAVQAIDSMFPELATGAGAVGLGTKPISPQGLIGRNQIATLVPAAGLVGGAALLSGFAAAILSLPVAGLMFIPRVQAKGLRRLGMTVSSIENIQDTARGLRSALEAGKYAGRETMTLGQAMERLGVTRQEKEKELSPDSLLSRLQTKYPSRTRN